MAVSSILTKVDRTGVASNRGKVVAPPQPTLARNLGHCPRECPTAQRQIQLNASFFCMVNLRIFNNHQTALML